MQIKLVGEKHALVVYLDGEIDQHTVGDIKNAIDKEIRRTNAVNVIMDFRKISFMDSSGIGMIMGRYRTVSLLGGTVILYGCTDLIQRLITMAGLGRLIKITNNLDNALMLL
jgi:stage II sporulation protein AA (anti-sigma F factor antagonist)